MPYFSARLDFRSPPLSAPGSPRMLWGREWVKDNKSIASTSHFKLVIKIMYPFNAPGEGEGKQSWADGCEAELLPLDTVNKSYMPYHHQMRPSLGALCLDTYFLCDKKKQLLVSKFSVL